jgi:hypothetical protein
VRLRNFRFALFIAGMICVSSSLAADPISSPTQERSALTEQDIVQAIEKLKDDPNLAIEHKTRTLKWRESKDRKQIPNEPLPSWLQWIGDLFTWLGETARVLVWLAAILLAAILIVWIVRFVRGFERRAAAIAAPFAPTHVRDMDIRPESLPDDIGKAALDLWERGEQRASLSLLYRGLLSRLAHQYTAPIRHSSTEGECRALAFQHLPARSHEYVGLLIRIWQGAVYGGINPQPDSVRYLCTHFSFALDQAAAAPIATTATARSTA